MMKMWLQLILSTVSTVVASLVLYIGIVSGWFQISSSLQTHKNPNIQKQARKISRYIAICLLVLSIITAAIGLVIPTKDNSPYLASNPTATPTQVSPEIPAQDRKNLQRQFSRWIIEIIEWISKLIKEWIDSFSNDRFSDQQSVFLLPGAFPLDCLGFDVYTSPPERRWESMSFYNPLEGTATRGDDFTYSYDPTLRPRADLALEEGFEVPTTVSFSKPFLPMSATRRALSM